MPGGPCLQAILLAGLALKRRWQEKRKAAGVTELVQPNIVCSSAVHVSLLYILATVKPCVVCSSDMHVRLFHPINITSNIVCFSVVHLSLLALISLRTRNHSHPSYAHDL